MKIFIAILGGILARTPESVIKLICNAIGFWLAELSGRRRRVLVSNLRKAYPNLDLKEIKRLARESAARTIELGLFVLVSPYFSEKEIKDRIQVSDSLLKIIDIYTASKRPAVLLIPHTTMMEAITVFPILVDKKIPKTGVFYRPFDIQAIEGWVKSTREKFGIELISRKDGLYNAFKYLREKQCVAILFDQNAGHTGIQTFFFDRICSTGDLGGIFVEKFDALCAIFYAKRTGFWRCKIYSDFIEGSRSSADITIAANDWLEDALKTGKIEKTDWLWIHNRWKTQFNPYERLCLSQKKSLLDYTMQKRGLSKMPQETLFFIRMPSDFEKARALAPLLNDMRTARPDVKFALLCAHGDAAKTETLACGDVVYEMPTSPFGKAAAKKLRDLAELYPDTHIVFEDSFAADFEARKLDAFQRFAMRSTRRRLFMTNVFKPSAAQLKLSYEDLMREFMQSYGLPKNGGGAK